MNSQLFNQPHILHLIASYKCFDDAVTQISASLDGTIAVLGEKTSATFLFKSQLSLLKFDSDTTQLQQLAEQF